MADSLVIIPTYNEIENIEKILQSIFQLEKEFHVLVVDDNSPDGTGDQVESLKSQYSDKLHLLKRKGKLGLGTAYIRGFEWGLKKRDYQYFFEMDADFSHPPKDLINLYKACTEGGADVAIGSRYIKGGKVENWPIDRLLLSYGASLYVRLITWMPVKDPTAGFICYKREVLESLDLKKIKFMGYAFQIEMKYRAREKGFTLGEVPITFVDRSAGESKMNKSIIKEAVFGVIMMRFS